VDGTESQSAIARIQEFLLRPELEKPVKSDTIGVKIVRPWSPCGLVYDLVGIHIGPWPLCRSKSLTRRDVRGQEGADVGYGSTTVLHDVTMEVPEGKLMALLG
jgi:hypothetical protein